MRHRDLYFDDCTIPDDDTVPCPAALPAALFFSRRAPVAEPASHCEKKRARGQD